MILWCFFKKFLFSLLFGRWKVPSKLYLVLALWLGTSISTASHFFFEETIAFYSAPGISHVKTKISGGSGSNGEIVSTEIYDPQTDKFEDGPDLPYTTVGHCGVRRPSTDAVYFAGGFPGPAKTAFIYDASQTPVFRNLGSQMTDGRHQHGCHLLDAEGIMVAAGGVGASGWFGSVEILDLVTEQWTKSTTAAFPSGLRIRFVSYHETFVAFCCVAGSDPINSEVYFYEHESETWELDTVTKVVGGPTNSPFIVGIDVDDAVVCQYKH